VARRKDEVKYRVNSRGEVVHAEVAPLPVVEGGTDPETREAYQRATIQALAAKGTDRRREALMKRLNERREARVQEREVAIRAAAEKAGDPDDHVTQEKLRLGDIVVPEEYQRTLNQDRAIGYALQFSWQAFQSISVNRRPDGTLVLTDGQHRLYAAQLAFGDDVLVKCNVTDIANSPQEAALFITMNTERTGLNYNAAFKARLHALDANALQVVDILTEYGLDYTKPGELRNVAGKVTAVSTLESMVRQGGRSSAREVLAILRDVQRGVPQPGAYRDFMMSGLWQFIVRYDRHYRRDRLVQALRRDGLEAVADSINSFKTGANSSDAAAACAAIHFAYNWHLLEKDALPPHTMESKNRYGAMVRKAARLWFIRHEGTTNGPAPARTMTGMYAPGSQNTATAEARRATKLPGDLS
jgi:hypothetical protein